jgi:hypothetical protein
MAMLSSGDTIHIGDGLVPLAGAVRSDANATVYTGPGPGVNPVYYLPGYDVVTVSADVLEVEMLLLNPEGNPYGLTFEIILKDTGEALYASGLVAPSMCIERITLRRALAEGRYEAVIIIRAYAQDNFTMLGETCMAVVIVAV